MNRNFKIGIRYEDKYLMERRVPLSPHHVKRLINEKHLEVILQKSSKRIFSDEDYIKVGAKIQDDLTECPIIFGVKEIPVDKLEKCKTYVFFSHVIKGQPYNMPMLKKIIELKSTLIDYECMTDETGKRVIFFGQYAGYAGMINTLWAAGQRYLRLGIETPFLFINQAHTYHSLNEIRHIISDIGFKISKYGLPHEIIPFTIGFTGYGNVSAGAQAICGLLPVKEISPQELLTLKITGKYVNNLVYKVIFKEEHISEPINREEEFDLYDYYKNPHKYKNSFERYVPELSLLLNCMYWNPKYPRIITKSFVKSLFDKGTPKLTVIGDITCDPHGSIEITHKGTEIQDPVFVYNPETGLPTMGFEGEGMLVMAVDILPSELPRESSIAFGDVLYRYVEPIAKADYTVKFEDLNLPESVKKAVIVYNGELTPNYTYLKKYIYE
ncbi:MAG TPA: bifunctional lysine ketoglutarate reductase /saccharopine dehydrogenase family protein [Bacteroidales bacterium]|nr:bifunctional lysine ketoglutarate reductase /saccharopine dehydrogenase family protein [Bacteroidales bacterium]